MFNDESIPDEFSIKGSKDSSFYYLIRQLGKIIYLMMRHFVTEIRKERYKVLMTQVTDLRNEKQQLMIENAILRDKLSCAEKTIFDLTKRKIPANFDEKAWDCVDGGFPYDPTINQSSCKFCGYMISHHGEANKINKHLDNNNKCKAKRLIEAGSGGDGILEVPPKKSKARQ